ncbi:cytochrome P450 [Rhodococcus opacus]|uniref:Cytochrome P450 n=1 Tax=Rhodococcus opacus TaxID=37919 RepID=A0A2S8J4P0_RHOOP|nr:cytochrome P450 [Rhodococcus opacus]PQP21998.1 hypothetical protein C5613_25000 [Rhodococcus opacus]
MVDTTAESLEGVPAHVPPELVVEFDPIAGHEVNTFPPSMLDAYRERGRVLYTVFPSFPQGIWVLTGHDDIRDAWKDHARFGQWGTVNEPKFGKGQIPLRLNPPDHNAYRRALMGIFSPGRLRAMEPEIRRTVRQMLSEISPKGSCEFVSEFGLMVPAATFCQMLGLPSENFARFNQIAIDLVYTPEHVLRVEGAERAAAVRQKAKEAAEKIISDQIQHRRDNPDDRNDVVSFLLNAQVGDRPMTTAEIENITNLLFYAGTDSTGAAITYAISFLATHPEHRRTIVEHPETIPKATEELLRMHGFHWNLRDVRDDTEFAGVHMKRGDLIMLSTGSANHDPTRFDAPTEVDFTREDTNPNMTFGAGVHRCLGAPLATMTLRVVLEELHRVIPAYEIDPNSKGVVYQTGQSKAIPFNVPLLYPAVHFNPALD